MNLDDVRLFVRVAVLNNISLAGKELNLSPAVSSAHLNKLESDLGVRLIHRTTRRVSLTEEGEAFLPHAVELLDSVEVARVAVGSGSVEPQGKLRVAAPASFGRMHLAPALAEFMKLFPKLRIDMNLSDRVTDLVEGGFDIAIRDAAMKNSSLVARKLAPVKRVICASPDYLEEYGIPETPQDLADHHCVNLMGIETWVFETKNGPQTIHTKNRLRTDNGEAARDACLAGVGITQSSTWCCQKFLQTGELVEVLQDYPLITDTAIWAVYPSSRLLAPKVRVFIDFFADRFNSKDYWS